MMKKLLAVVGVTLLLAACQEKEQVVKPDPMQLNAEAAGFYCQMTVLDHEGPKARSTWLEARSRFGSHRCAMLLPSPVCLKNPKTMWQST